MTLIFALLFSPIFADSCHHVTDQTSTELTDREGQLVHNGATCTTIKGETSKTRSTKEESEKFANEELLGKLHFSYNSSKVRSDAQDMLMNAAQQLDQKPYKKVILRGFADQSGRQSYNKKLSLKRARKVKKWLTRWGIPSKKMSVEALGESAAKNRQTARRVEIKVIR